MNTDDARTLMHEWIENVDPGPAFRADLEQAAARQFGEDGSSKKPDNLTIVHFWHGAQRRYLHR